MYVNMAVESIVHICSIIWRGMVWHNGLSHASKDHTRGVKFPKNFPEWRHQQHRRSRMVLNTLAAAAAESASWMRHTQPDTLNANVGCQTESNDSRITHPALLEVPLWVSIFFTFLFVHSYVWESPFPYPVSRQNHPFSKIRTDLKPNNSQCEIYHFVIWILLVKA